MNEIEAAVGIGNLDVYPGILKRRRKNFIYLMNKFKDFDRHLYTFQEQTYEKIGPHAFPIILREGNRFTRDDLVFYLKKNGVDSRNLFTSIPTQCPGFKYLGYKMGDFPHAEFIGDNGLHIGIHQDLGQPHMDYIINLIKKFLSKNA
jgi:dTDP-4-amino-4,6-dideoxygalactose transaminase